MKINDPGKKVKDENLSFQEYNGHIISFYNNDNTFMTQYYDPDSVQNISKPTD